MMPMRTTVTLPDDLLRLARKRSAEMHRPLKEVLADALRIGLNGTAGTGKAQAAFRFPVVPGGGVLPGVNLESNSDLLDLMDGLR